MKREPDDVRHGHPICEPLLQAFDATRVTELSDRPDLGRPTETRQHVSPIASALLAETARDADIR